MISKAEEGSSEKALEVVALLLEVIIDVALSVHIASIDNVDEIEDAFFHGINESLKK